MPPINETNNKESPVMQPAAPPVDRRDRPNCRAQTVCFEDETEKLLIQRECNYFFMPS